MATHHRPLMAVLLSLGALGLVAAATVPASATGIYIGDYALTGPGPTTWDTDNGDSPCSAPSSGFSPADDGSYGDRSDAFDGALVLTVNGSTVADYDGYANVSGNTAATFGGKFGGVTVSRVDVALKQSPTLRSLVKFQNPSKSLKSLDVELDTDLGSDSGTVVVKTSSGDTTHTANDNWVISNDGSPSSGDPVVTQVYGKGGSAAKTLPTALTNGGECVSIDYTVKVPAGKSRYLLLFLQMHTSNRSAKKGAVPFNLLSAGSALLDGIPAKVLPQIVNWKL